MAAMAAEHFGDSKLELEYLDELVRRSPLNRQWLMQYAEKLANARKFDQALECTETLKSLAPNDPQVEATIQRIQMLAAKPKK